jgi:hypothetical protein|tara:strand:+ start:10010 stop:10741 length:732 start_codon:yes stop_codon:yes gene_type:complete
MEEYYLTDNIRLYNDKMEYKKDDIFLPVKKYNWHHILNEYGWEKIHKPWIMKLNQLSVTKEKNSRFGMLDCESDGDCFFHCIANSLNERDINTDNYYISDDIRKLISDNITQEQFNLMITTYRIMKDADDFSEKWDPYEIDTLEDFKNTLNTSGHSYWGDFMLLQVLSEILKVNIYILNTNEYQNEYNVYHTMCEYKRDYDNIFLLLENDCHFKLVGYFDEKMITYFRSDDIPIELKKLVESL